MSKIIALLTLAFQFTLTFIVIFCIYMFFALLDNDFGLDGLVGLFIFQPIFGIILSVLTIIVCFIVGLPIRLNKKLNYWWTTNFYISIIGAICGLTLLVIALLPNTVFLCMGWFLTAFSLLHIYPPRQLTEKIKKLADKN